MTFSNNLIIYVNYENNKIDSESSLPYHATLTFAGKQYKCSVGRNGINHKGQEGDGVTPIGEFTLRMGFFRSDRVDSSILSKVKGIPLIELHENYGWCDDMFDPVHYNRLVQLPVLEGLSSEKLWRQDNLYDLFAVIGYNDNPIQLGRGSAIFFHVASDNYGPTSGCVALKREDLFEVFSKLTPFTIMKISQSLEL